VAQADVACGTEEGGYGGACDDLSTILGPGDQIFPPSIDPSKPVLQGLGGVFMPGANVDGGAPAPNVVILPLRGAGVVTDTADVDTAALLDPFRDRFWPKTVISYLILAAILTMLSIQFVSPTRRWRPSLPGPVRRLVRRRSAP
jgi:hypothetical protein